MRKIGSIAALALALAAAGCGGDDGKTAGEKPAATAGSASAEEVTHAYLEATMTGDGKTACALLGPDARQQLSDKIRSQVPELKTEGCEDGITKTIEAAKGRDEIEQVREAMDEVEVELTVTGDKATGHAIYQGERASNDIELTRLDGQWRITGGFES